MGVGRRFSAVCRDRELLAALVASEDAMVEHQAGCMQCRTGGAAECSPYVDLVIQGAGCMLTAKLWLDSTNPSCLSVS